MSLVELFDGLIAQVEDNWIQEYDSNISRLATEDYEKTQFVRKLWLKFLSDIGSFNTVISAKKQSEDKIYKSDVETHLRNLLVTTLRLMPLFKLNGATIVEIIVNWVEKRIEENFGSEDFGPGLGAPKEMLSTIKELWPFDDKDYSAANNILFEDAKTAFYIEHIIVYLSIQVGVIAVKLHRWDHSGELFFNDRFNEVLVSLLLGILRLLGCFDYQTSDLTKLVNDWKGEIKTVS